VRPSHPLGLLTALLAWIGVFAIWARLTRHQPPMPSLRPDDVRRVVTDDGLRLHVEVGGRDDRDLTVVFVHGLLARSAEFDPQWEPLLGRARLVRYDHRGHGRSARLGKATNVEQLGRDLGRVLDAAAPVGPVVLVGHSMGGMTVMALAAQRPELFGSRVRGIVLLGTAAGHDIDGHPFENTTRHLARLRLLNPLFWLLRVLAPVLERLRPRNTWLLRRGVRALTFGSGDANTSLVAQVQQMLEEPPLTTLAALQGDLVRHDKRAALGVLAQVPVAVVTGADDRLIRAEHSVAIARDLGGAAELVVLPGVGHVLNRSAPHDVNAAIDRLLERAGLSEVLTAAQPSSHQSTRVTGKAAGRPPATTGATSRADTTQGAT
jgi:pimeloyl-ACP methyl ester carboxylesterase